MIRTVIKTILVTLNILFITGIKDLNKENQMIRGSLMWLFIEIIILFIMV